jgi:hydroxymethylglutaryl-CoA lyase
MSEKLGAIEIREGGPRKGFQIVPGPIPASRKIELNHALAKTGLKRIQRLSFVDPNTVPKMADADAIAPDNANPAGHLAMERDRLTSF